MNISINRLLGGFAAPFLLVCLAIVTFPRTTEAAEKTLFKTEGASLAAIFVSSVGSVSTIANIQAVQSVTSGDVSQKTGFVVMLLQYFDSSTSTQYSATAISEHPVIEQRSNLGSATLRDTIPVEFSIDTFPGGSFIANVIVDLTWTGVGPITRQSSRDSSNTFDTIFMFKSTGISRSAEASGSVIAKSTPNGDINFTPGPSEPEPLTQMGSTNDGSITIIKTK
jgi:hypothetical protein